MDEINEHYAQASQSNKTLKIFSFHLAILSVLHDITVHFSDIGISFSVNISQFKVRNTNNCLVILPAFCIGGDSKETPVFFFLLIICLLIYYFFSQRKVKNRGKILCWRIPETALTNIYKISLSFLIVLFLFLNLAIANKLILHWQLWHQNSYAFST